MPATAIAVAALLLAPLWDGGAHIYALTVFRLAAVLALALAAWSRSRHAPADISACDHAQRIEYALAAIVIVLLAAGYGYSIAVYKAAAAQWTFNTLMALAFFLLPLVLDAARARTLLLGAAALAPFLALVGFIALVNRGGLPLEIYGIGDNNPRVGITFFNPNRLAGAMVLPISIALAAAAALYRERATRRKAEVVFAVGVVPAAMLALLTRSRSGVIAFAVALVVLAAAWLPAAEPQRRRKGLVLIGGGGVFAAAGMILLRLRSTDVFAFDRFEIYREAMRIFFALPMGVGTGMYKYYSAPFRVPHAGFARYAIITEHPHAFVLQWLTEWGLTGVIGALALLIVAWRAGVFASLRKTLSGQGVTLVAGAWAAAIGLFVFLNLGAEAKSPLLMAHFALACGYIFAHTETTVPLPAWVRRLPSWLPRLAFVPVAAVLIWLVAASPGYATAYRWRMEAKKARFDSPDRAELLARAIAAAPDDFVPPLEIARLFFSRFTHSGLQVDFNAALEALAAAQRLNPRATAVVRDRGTMMTYLAEHPEWKREGPPAGAFDPLAVEAWRELLALDPYDATAYENLSRLARRRGDRKAALEYAARAVELEPDFLRMRVAVVELLLDDNRADAARTAAAALLQRFLSVRAAIGTDTLRAYESNLLSIDPHKMQTVLSRAGLAVPGGLP